MDFIFDAALDQWHDWETTPAQWILLNGNYPPDRVGQVWVSDVVPYEVTVPSYNRQPVTGPTRTVDNSQHLVTYDCENPDFGTISADPPGISKLCLAKVGTNDSDSLLLAAYDLSFTETGPLQPLVAPSGAYWVSPMEPDTYTLTFQAPPEGVEAGGRSAWLNVPAATEITTITWQNLPDGVVNVYNEAFGTDVWTTLSSPPSSGTMDLDAGTLMLDVPTRISIGPTMDMGPGAKVEFTVLGAAGSQSTPPDAEWLPPGPYEYWLETEWHTFVHAEPDEGYTISSGSTNRRAEFSFPSRCEIEYMEILSQGDSIWQGALYLRPGAQEYSAVLTVTAGAIWTETPEPPIPDGDRSWDMTIVDIREYQLSINETDSGAATLQFRMHVINSEVRPPDDWPGLPGGPEVTFVEHPLPGWW